MKTNGLLVLAVAGAMSFTACTKKIDEKTMSQINQFETEWNALGERATAWSQELTQTTNQSKEFAAQQAQIVNDLATSKDQQIRQKAEESARIASENASRLESMQNEWNAFQATWDETSTQYAQWKERVTKGEITPEEATTGLTDFQSRMADAQSRIETWTTAYAEVKQSTQQNMAMASETQPQPQPAGAH